LRTATPTTHNRREPELLRAFTIACLLAVIWLPTAWADGDPAHARLGTARGVLERGREVFEQTCVKCHGDETSNAPFIGDRESWEPRVEQGIQTLVRHALEGHGGPDGMPPKGGFAQLGNEDVAAAVSYLVHESRQLGVETRGLLSACDGPDRERECTPEMAKKYLILYLLRGLSEKNR
jgi:cytochrome c5